MSGVKTRSLDELGRNGYKRRGRECQTAAGKSGCRKRWKRKHLQCPEPDLNLHDLANTYFTGPRYLFSQFRVSLTYSFLGGMWSVS
jgi:hypothetical protein